MKIDGTRALELILAALACFCVGNAITNSLLGGGSVLPGEHYTPATIFGVAWLFFLWAEPRRLS